MGIRRKSRPTEMVTLGVDLAAQPRHTAVCLVSWRNGRAKASVPELNIDDQRLHTLAADADKVGIDVPFGWPSAFVDSVAAYRRGEPWPGHETHELRLRKTDRFVQAKTEKTPLSVSTDRIGITAFRAAGLLSKLGRAGPVERTGKGKFVEVYPAAALRRWNIGPCGQEDTPALLAALLSRTSKWLRLSQAGRDRCKESRDALDALIAALVARASALGLCDPIPKASGPAAKAEGWIALPMADSLDRLATEKV
jgi:hypothetical protein